ncbi:MAG: hypothetical protein BroJett031_23500 [Betaproteobacteria bacterium]|nr:MAG: hypothetical protein BroJett031_23500 [Betaproteobacteria bacterium]
MKRQIAPRKGGKKENTVAKLIVKKSINISASPLKVWNIITSPDAIRRWMLVVPVLESDGPLQLGSRIRWNDEHGQTYLSGTVVTLDPPHKLVLALEDISWTRKARPGEVTYALTLSESEGGTRLEFVLGDLAIDPEGQQWFDAYSASRELDIIKGMAEGQP